MKLKTKRLLAAALAISLTANISLAAFAVTYDIDDGDVYVYDNDAGNTESYQAQESGNTEVVEDDTVIVVQGDEAYEAVSTAEETAKENGDDFTADDVAEILDGYETPDEETNNSVIIKDNVENATVIVGDVNIEIDETSGDKAAISVGDGSDVDIYLVGENEITLDAAGTSGIQVGTDGATEETNVTLTVDGTTTINVSDKVAEKQSEGAAGYNTAGIAVGGGAVDAAGSGNANLTITGGNSEDDNANIIINNTSEGILVHGGSSLTIGEDEEHDDPIDITIDGSAVTKDGDLDAKPNYSGSGRGLISYGTTIIKDGANLLVKDSADRGISVFTNDLQIKDGATVTVENSARDGVYAEQGAGIVVSGENTSLTVNNASNNSVDFGITVEGTGSTTDGNDLTVSDGATVTVNNSVNGIQVTGGGSIKIYGNNEEHQTSVNVNNSGTGIYFNNDEITNAELYVTGNALLNVVNDSAVTRMQTYGIVAQNTDITVENGAQIILDGAVSGDGIYLSGSNAAKMLVTGEGTLVEIKNYGNMSEASLYVIANKSIVIEDNATVKIDGTQSNGLYLNGNDTNLIVDNATLEMDGSRIVIAGTEDEETSLPHIEVRNGSRVVTSYVYDSTQKNGGEFWIMGGTAELTGVGKDSYSVNSWVGSTDSENLLSMLTKTIWPTSGEENGDEKLTGFKLSVSELETLQAELWAEDKDLSAEEFFDKYGFLIEYDEERNPTTLTFQTYGVVDGEYYNYNEKKDNGTSSNWYVVDLTKGYGDELWVWTPAVVLSYFTLNEGKTLGDAKDYDESDPYKVTVGNELTGSNYHDVVVRGQSIAFGNFQTNSDYTTTDELEDTAYAIAKKVADEKGIVLYIYDAMDNGVAADSIDPEKDIIIVKGEDGKFYIANTDGSASETVAGTYYYALIDDEGNYKLDDNGNFIWYDEDGVAYTAESENVALIAVLDSGTSYVLLASDGNYYRVNSNGEYTTVVAGEAISVGSLWAVFDENTRVRSNAQANNATYYFENAFGGVGATVTEIEPADEPKPEEEPTPTPTPDPDEPEPIIPIVPVVPADPSTPAQPETPTETPAETPADPEAPAETPEAPASSTPKTGDDSNVAIYLVMAALSGAALIGLGVTGKKKNEEV